MRSPVLSKTGRGSVQATRLAMACRIGCTLQISYGRRRVVVQVSAVDQRTTLTATLTVFGSQRNAKPFKVTFPALGVNLAHEKDRVVPDASSICQRPPLPRTTIDQIFRYIGPLDFPDVDLRNPGGLDPSEFMSVRTVVNHIATTPVKDLKFPGRCLSPWEAGEIHREHRKCGGQLGWLSV